MPLVVLPALRTPQHVGQEVMGSVPGRGWHGTARHGWAGAGQGHGSGCPGLGRAVPAPAGSVVPPCWHGQAPEHTQRGVGSPGFKPMASALTAQDGSLLPRTGVRAGVGKGESFRSAGRVWKASLCPCSCPGRRAGMTLLAEPGCSGLWVWGSPGRAHLEASAA